MYSSHVGVLSTAARASSRNRRVGGNACLLKARLGGRNVLRIGRLGVATIAARFGVEKLDAPVSSSLSSSY